MRLLLLSLGGERSVSRKADGAPRGAVTHYKPISDPESVGTTRRQPSLGRPRQRLALEHRAEPLRLEQMATAELEPELGEDRGRVRVARRLGLSVLGDEPVAELVETLVGREDSPHDELRGDGAVPPVLRETERDVPPPLLPVHVEQRAGAERDRTAGVAAVAANAEAQVLSFSDRRELAELAARSEKRHVGVAEPERRELRELGAQLERQPRPARHDPVHARRRPELVVAEHAGGVRGEPLGERRDVLGLDGEAGGSAVPAPATEQVRARGEPGVEVERRNRTPGALPVALTAGDEDDGPVEALDEPGGDDSDHALVPVPPGDDIRAPPAVGLR